MAAVAPTLRKPLLHAEKQQDDVESPTETSTHTHEEKIHSNKITITKFLQSYGIYVLIATVLSLALMFWNKNPEGLALHTWHIFLIFVSTIFCIVLDPMPIAGIAVVSLCISVVSKTLDIKTALSGFSLPVVWLVVFAFFIARGFVVTGLGKRMCYVVLYTLGSSSLGLAYGVCLAEVVLSPAIPSNTARGVGVLMPVLQPLIVDAFGCSPEKGNSRKIGAFLMQVAYHANCIASGMYLTGSAAVAMTPKLAEAVGVNISWLGFFIANCVPCMLLLALMPLVLYFVYPPEVKATPEARELASKKLSEMGPLSRNEWIMLGTFLTCVALWVLGDLYKFMDATTTALVGVTLLLLLGVLDVKKDILTEKAAWDVLVWFAALVMLAEQLGHGGMFKWFADIVKESVSAYTTQTACALLVGLFYYSHYLFASGTAHCAALYGAFLSVALAANGPPQAMSYIFGTMCAFSGGITHYGTGTGPAYFAAGYVPLSVWWGLGFVVSVLQLGVYASVGMAWWKAIGLI
eukprot:GDKI01025005.1.p1 GENE.GDKI01025005.1~~GDKI01025005.1.p1  ORF type:complete len:519 (+),score=153.06 GDKI01025005.1:126-1682(+)